MEKLIKYHKYVQPHKKSLFEKEKTFSTVKQFTVFFYEY